MGMEAGCSRDQMSLFTAAGYVALPALLPFHALARNMDKRMGVTEVLLDGTRGSAKSHAIIAQVGLDDCQRFPGLKFLFLRQTQKAASESFEDLVARVLKGVTHAANSERIEFPNGSKIVIGGYRDDRDIQKYIGIEYDGLVLEEATQISGEKYLLLNGSIRTSRTDWMPRNYISTNPGGLGHSFYKERFVLPAETGNEINTRRFFTSYKDNPFINIEYKMYLEGLTGDLGKAWRDGDWDVFAGQAFPTWREDRHVIDPFDIPPDFYKWRAIDWGYTAPFCCLWFMRDPDTRRIYVYREAYQTKLTEDKQAALINDMTPLEERIHITYADPAMWASKTMENFITSSADIYSRHGIPLIKADNGRLSGKRKVDRLLATGPDGSPGIQVFKSCTNLIRTLPKLIYDNTNIEDVDSDSEDHAYDALKYGLTIDSARKKFSAYENPWLAL
jgi:PBSX family phage terminase large subunit